MPLLHPAHSSEDQPRERGLQSAEPVQCRNLSYAGANGCRRTFLRRKRRAPGLRPSAPRSTSSPNLFVDTPPNHQKNFTVINVSADNQHLKRPGMGMQPVLGRGMAIVYRRQTRRLASRG